MGNKLAVMKIKSNDLVMNLARHRYSLIVHTEGLCLRAAEEASSCRWHLRWRGIKIGDRQCRVPVGAG